MPARDGEICIVCYGRTTRFDLAFTVDGERYAVMKGLEKEFLKNPDDYIRKFKVRQASFGGVTLSAPKSSTQSRGVHLGAGLVVVLLSVLFWWLDRRLRRDPSPDEQQACSNQ